MNRMMRIVIATVCAIVMAAEMSAQSDDVLTELKIDPAVTVGTLDNGLRYYVRRNTTPRNRAELRLVVNAGSMQEDDNQRGLAHFVEHMAFNGTENFPKNTLVKLLESLGSRFGADLNAYTSFDETVYMLQLPTDTLETFETGFKVLGDWAYKVSFDGDEIEKERGVVIEEWRLGRGAEERMRQKYWPVLMAGSRYAQRIPIGKKEILDNFDHETLKQFYRDWYRPDLMAVVAVGDFEPAHAERLIKRFFGPIPMLENPRPREEYRLGSHKGTKVAIATDPEARFTMLRMQYKKPREEHVSVGDFRRQIVYRMFSGMLNSRLEEIKQKPNPPFMFSGVNYGGFVRTMDAYSMFGIISGNNVKRAIEIFVEENERVRQHGFTPSELERERKRILRGAESAFNERDKTESRRLAGEYVRNFLSGEPIPGVASEFEMYRRFVPAITLEEINALSKDWISKDDHLIIITAPEREGVEVPSERDVLALVDRLQQQTVAAYEDVLVDKPLLAQEPKPGSIVSESVRESIGVREWTLSNGARVIIKQTDFKNDEILMRAFSPGGASLYSDEDNMSAIFAGEIIGRSGVAEFDEISLQKQLSGKLLRLRPWLTEREEGFRGSSSPEDFETLLQLLYLYSTAPRMDPAGLSSFVSEYNGFIANKAGDPRAAFQDTIGVTMAQYHPRRRPMSTAILEEINLERSYAIYRERFADAGDFTFVFVGNLDLASARPLIEKYIGALPAAGRQEEARDIGLRYPQGTITKTLRKGVEPQSQVQLIFSGPFTFTNHNRISARAMLRVLNMKLRESLREEQGGTYGASARSQFTQHPQSVYRINIGFGCAPDNAETLIEAAFAEIRRLQNEGPTDEELRSVREILRRDRETNLRENRFWLRALAGHYAAAENPESINNYDSIVDAMTPASLQQEAQKYFDWENLVRVVLLPKSAGAVGEGGSTDE